VTRSARLPVTRLFVGTGHHASNAGQQAERGAARGSAALALVVAVFAMVAATIALARGQAPEASSLLTQQPPSPSWDESPMAAAGLASSNRA